MCLLASMAYFCPGPGSSEAILLMAAWQSVKMVTKPRAWFLDAAEMEVVVRSPIVLPLSVAVVIVCHCDFFYSVAARLSLVRLSLQQPRSNNNVQP